MHGYLCWCILLGYLYVSALSLGSGKYRGRGTGSEGWLRDFAPAVSYGSERSITKHFKRSDFSFPYNNSVSCEDLKGVGSFNTTCLLNSNLYLNSDLYIYGTGNLEILPHVSIGCHVQGCIIVFNMSGNVNVGQYATVHAGSIVFSAANLTLEQNSSINTTSLGGSPPPQTSGTPVGYDGAGGGHGGRGASCLKNNLTSFWGGDVYAWSSLSEPSSYGSKGGGTSPEKPFGGNGGGRVKLIVKEILYLNGSLTAEGGDGGPKGGGGSGGSVFIHAVKLPLPAPPAPCATHPVMAIPTNRTVIYPSYLPHPSHLGLGTSKVDRLPALGGRRGSNGRNSNSSTSKETRKSRDRDSEPARLALRPQLRESWRRNYGHRVNSQAGRARVVEWVGVKDKRGPKTDELLKLVPNQTQISGPKPLVQDRVDLVTDQEPIEYRSDVDDPQEAFGEDDPVGQSQVNCDSQLDVQKSVEDEAAALAIKTTMLSRPCDIVEADGGGLGEGGSCSALGGR
uniref:Uncharacterized protein n=1 Tax=Fagus sylvatica TaxID=28930 RepID=A0A2N9H8K5_FAGSY